MGVAGPQVGNRYFEEIQLANTLPNTQGNLTVNTVVF
jgi:hypothetical protein